MSRIRLKCGGKHRRKALFGIDAGITAAATLAAAGMQVAATTAAAKSQAKAMVENAKTQAQSIKDQTNNSNNLQKEQLAFTRSQNQENRQQQQDIQATLQMLAGQENMNDRMEANKMQVKYGGKPKRTRLSTTLPYGGGQQAPFQVTDGGGVIPVAIDPSGYGLYELVGNDHEHYHKTSGGKNKTGVGIKFNDGSVVEGEGNQNTNQGELLYVTPNDAMFISKHSIDGFNPTEAVKQGVHPIQAFNIQEILKARKGLNDDGSKAKCGKRRSLKRMLGGPTQYLEQVNMTQNPNNCTGSVAGGVIYGINNSTTSPVEDINYNIAKCGKRIHLKCGGRKKAIFGYNPLFNIIPGGGVNGSIGLGGVYNTQPTGNSGSTVLNTNFNNTNNSSGTTGIKGNNFWNDYAGATYNAAGNLLSAGISTLGNIWAANRLNKAYTEAGNILVNAYSQMHGIDMKDLKMEDYAAPHTLAVVRDANNVSYDPQRERIRRNSASERREINRGTLSSAARQQRLAATNDRMMQRISEIDSTENTAREQIRQGNAERITQTAQENANRDIQARRDFNNQRLSLLQYNNDIENTKITGAAQARADALTQSSTLRATALQNSANAIGSALAASGRAFGRAYEMKVENQNQIDAIMSGLDPKTASSRILDMSPKEAQAYYDRYIKSPNPNLRAIAKEIAASGKVTV